MNFVIVFWINASSFRVGSGRFVLSNIVVLRLYSFSLRFHSGLAPLDMSCLVPVIIDEPFSSYDTFFFITMTSFLLVLDLTPFLLQIWFRPWCMNVTHYYIFYFFLNRSISKLRGTDGSLLILRSFVFFNLTCFLMLSTIHLYYYIAVIFFHQLNEVIFVSNYNPC